MASEDVLISIPLFSMLSKRELRGLSKDVHERTFAAGTLLTDEGEFGSVFTVIAEGTATVLVKGSPVKTLGPGDYFGEMALIDRHNRRSATVRADTDLHAIMMTQPVFRPFAMDHPEVAWALLELMVQRVREAQARD
jgi:CRP-like cAMP-binding protein